VSVLLLTWKKLERATIKNVTDNAKIDDRNASGIVPSRCFDKLSSIYKVGAEDRDFLRCLAGSRSSSVSGNSHSSGTGTGLQVRVQV